MRVIRCPSCQEPLPGTAKYCAKCGVHLLISEHTLKIIDENLLAPTIKIAHRPAALKVARFYTVDTGNNNGNHRAGSRMKVPIQQSRRNDLISVSQTIPAIQPWISERDVSDDDDLQRRANWQKVVTYKTPRVAPVLITPPAVPVVYRTPVGSTPPALISIRRTSPKKPPPLPMRLFSWISILILIGLLLGGLLDLQSPSVVGSWHNLRIQAVLSHCRLHHRPLPLMDLLHYMALVLVDQEESG